MPLPIPKFGVERPAIHRWIKTDCGRAKYAELASQQGLFAWLRLAWFVVIAALRDSRLPNPEQIAPTHDSPSADGS